MKIAHVVCTYPPYRGGMGNSVHSMVQTLEKLGHTIDVITPLYNKEVVKDDKPNVKRLPVIFSYGNAAIMKGLSKILDEYDIVHLHYPFFGTANIVRRWRQKNKNKHLVITYHMDAQSLELKKNIIFRLCAKYLMPKILQSADVLITSSFDFMNSSQAKYVFANTKEKWHSIPFGVDTKRFSIREKSAELLSAHDLDPKLPTILFVGGMDPSHYFKGIDILISALRILQQKRIPFQAIFVGEGSLRTKFELEVKGFGLEKSIYFVGGASESELPRYYNLADLFVLPSINRAEAFGMVLLESMASGVPVLASDLPGVRTVAQKGGGVVEPGDPMKLAEAIIEYFEVDPQERKYCAHEVRDVVEKWYSWEFVAQELDKIYTDLQKN